MADAPTGPLTLLAGSWELSMRARSLSPTSVRQYDSAVRRLDERLTAGRVRTAEQVTRGHVETYVADLAATRSPATVHARYTSLRLFFAWCVEEGEPATARSS